MMDRDEKDNLPKMQIGFIDSICLPLYRVNYLLALGREFKGLTYLILILKKGAIRIVSLGQTYLRDMFK